MIQTPMKPEAILPARFHHLERACPTIGRGMACKQFVSQFYRPFLCANCFRDIALHFPDLWKLEHRSDADVYVNSKTGREISARAGIVSASSASGPASRASHRWNTLAKGRSPMLQPKPAPQVEPFPSRTCPESIPASGAGAASPDT